jgi:hypothetical protein
MAVSAKVLGVNVAGYFESEKGVGEAARASVGALKTVPIPYVLNNVTDSGSWNRERSSSNYSETNPHPVNLVHVNADQVPRVASHRGDAYFRGRYNIGYWFWELSHFPEEWSSSFEYFDEVWVGSNFALDAISRVSPIPVVRMLCLRLLGRPAPGAASSWGGQRPSLAYYVTLAAPTDGATAAGGRSCCLRSRPPRRDPRRRRDVPAGTAGAGRGGVAPARGSVSASVCGAWRYAWRSPRGRSSVKPCRSTRRAAASSPTPSDGACWSASTSGRGQPHPHEPGGEQCARPAHRLRFRDLPLTSERVWRALCARRAPWAPKGPAPFPFSTNTQKRRAGRSRAQGTR